MSRSFLLSKSLAFLSNSLISLKRQDQIIFLTGNLITDKKGKHWFYMGSYNSHLCMGLNSWAIPHLLFRKGGDDIWSKDHLQKENENTQTKYQQQQHYIRLLSNKFLLGNQPTYALLFEPTTSPTTPYSWEVEVPLVEWLIQDIYLRSPAFFSHNFQGQ